MKITHVILFNFYYDNAYYQENILPIQNKKDGHDVRILASTINLIEGKRVITKPSTYTSKYGIQVTRLPYKSWIPKKINDKIRLYKDVYKNLNDFKPQIIYVHGIGGLEHKSILKYLKENPNTKLFIDCHSDFDNSASTFFSRFFLHKMLYKKPFLRLAKYAEKVYYITPESLEFLKELYNFDDNNKLEYLPLGGYIPENELKQKNNKKIRTQLNIDLDDTILIHSGKLDENKKSFELLKGFSKFKSEKFKLIILGRFTDDVYDRVKHFIDNDNRIYYLGWKSADELQKYLMAGDIYMQPGSRTVTVQNAACNGCALIVNRSLCYTYLFGDNALYAETAAEILEILNNISEKPELIENYKEKAVFVAKEKLDYKVLANKYIPK